MKQYVKALLFTTYTGQTGRLFGTMIKQPQNTVRWAKPHTCLALHIMATSRFFNWQRVDILGSTKSQRAYESTKTLYSVDLRVNK